MSETPEKTAEPTENQGGGTTTATILPESPTVDEAEAEPTENQGGGSD